jgi:hypothetical protein
VPSRPGEFHPEPLTDPDLTLIRLVPPHEACCLPLNIVSRYLYRSQGPNFDTRSVYRRGIRNAGVAIMHQMIRFIVAAMAVTFAGFWTSASAQVAAGSNGSELNFKIFLMVYTCEVFKFPVRCAACGSEQQETMLRIAQGTPVVCVECRQEIDLPNDNSETFSEMVASWRESWLGRQTLGRT